MTKKIIHLTILLFTFLSCNKLNETGSLSLDNSKREKVDHLTNRYLELNRFSGTVLVSKNETILYNQSFGFADYENRIPFSSNTAFKIGEITELVTYNIVDNLAKEESINLTDKLSLYLPEIESDITINDIINHNTNIDYNTLGKLLEKVSQKTYQELIEKYSAALGLENTYFQKNDPSSAVGYLYHNYQGKGLELQKSPTYDLKEAFSSKGLKSTGIDLMKILNSSPKDLDIDGYIGNDGFSYSLTHTQKDNISIIILSNRKHPVAKEISNGIKAILEDKAFKLPLLREPFDIDQIILKDFTGSYSLNESVNFEVQNSNDSLYVLMGPNKIYLVPQSSNQFYMEQMDAAMRFLRDSTDLVNRVVLLNGFIDSEQTANRIK